MQPLILLPGMMCDERLFAHQVQFLSSHFEIVVPNYLGHRSISSIATSVLDNAPERFFLGGLSMGGIVAMEIIRQAPHRVEKLALMDTNPRAELPDVKANREFQIEKSHAGKLLEVMRDELKPNYLADGKNKDVILELCMDMAMDLGPKAFEDQSRALQTRIDYQQSLKEVFCSTLILCGEEDRLCPIERHKLMHRIIPDSELLVIEGAGHLPTLEKPEIVSKLLLDFLSMKK